MAFSYVPVTDISRHQGAVDFNLMAARGVQAVIIRLGNGTKNDDRAAEYVPAARTAGLALGGYWFCNPKVDRTGADQMVRMVRRGNELGPFDLPFMMDVESYTNEPNGSYPALSGQDYMHWLENGADKLSEADPHGDRPLVYTNRAYFDGMNMTAGGLADCPLIVARYPFYFQGAPQPPTDPDQWDDWILAATAKRPQVPVGWADWDGWQFAAGYDRMGPVYGTSSTDLDLNIVKPESYAAWTSHSEHIDSRPDVVPPPIVAPTTNTEDDVYFTHNEPYDGQPAGWHFWKLMPDGTKRHVDGVELDEIAGARESAAKVSAASIDSRADYAAPSAGGVSAPTHFVGTVDMHAG